MYPIGFPADCAVQGVDGTIFIIRNGFLHAKYPDSWFFEKVVKTDTDLDGAVLLTFDNAGNLYYSGRWSGKLWRSTNYGKSFSLCLDLKQKGHFRGFAVDSSGTIYVGTYGWEGPAVLFCSKDDGANWSPLRTFQCRHIHDVAVNPFTNWLYVVCGEKKEACGEEANYIFRSKDGGISFESVVQPSDGNKRRRPLFLSIGFKNDVCLLSTDHSEGDNYVAAFKDTGDATLYTPQKVLEFPDIPFGNGKGKGYGWGFLYNKEKVYTVCTGEYKSILYSSSDGEAWQEESSKEESIGSTVEIGSYNNYTIISGKENSYFIQDNYSRYEEKIYHPDPELWKKVLLKHDSRYEEGFGRGYYWRSLDAEEKASQVFSALEEYGIPKDGFIADIGCGIGPIILWGRCLGYRSICGIESNPRWLITARRIYESCFKGETPVFRLVPRGKMMIPQIFNTPYHAILVLGVFVGKGHGLDLEESLRHCYENLREGGVLCFNVNPGTYEEESPDFCLNMLEQLGMRNIRWGDYHGTSMITASK